MIWTPRADPTDENTTKSGRMIITLGIDWRPTRDERNGARPRNWNRVRQ